MTPLLFEPIQIRDITFKNRVFVSPMCQYSATNGVPNDWHYVHLGSFATGGAALVITEATAVNPEGRISYGDAGLWNEEQEASFKKIATFIKSQGSILGMQLAHAGRKASTELPWKGGKSISASEENGWQVLGPSAVKFSEHSQNPKELSLGDIEKIKNDFRASAERAIRAGIQVIELHGAHGYLLHQFLSPLSNHRTDQYGGSLENRMRFPLEVSKLVRDVMPSGLPLFMRISATDWAPGGWEIEQSIKFAIELKKIGVDLIDTSTGGLVPGVKIPVGPHYQVPFASEIKKGANILTGAVGMITDAKKANEVVEKGEADVVLLAREMLRNPHWALHAAKELGAKVPSPSQYERAFS
jgi:2,4-dienoyl-CoA reductase-like NADH-dependent reductase (Old Yellow Enzyme family)